VSETLHGLLDGAAARHPGQAVRFPSAGESVSYRELAASARGLAGELAAEGMGRGEPVGVLSPNAPEFLRSLFAVTAAGGAACPLPLPFGLREVASYGQRLARIAEVAGMRRMVVSPRLGSLADDLAALLPGLELRHASAVGTAPAALPQVTGDETAIVQFTSGSTAQPKGVRLTHRNVLAGLTAISSGIALGAGDGGGFWLPLFHDMGLFGVMTGLGAGIPLHIWSPVSFLKSPARWLREFQASGATISAMPDFGYEMLTAAVSPQEAAELDLSRLRIAFNGAEPVRHDTVAAFTARFAPSGLRPEAMFSVYGLAEATLAVTFPPLHRAPVFDWIDGGELAAAGRAVPVGEGTARARAVAGVGRPVHGIELRIVAPASGLPVPDGVVGEIQIRGPAVTAGYLGQTAAEAAASLAGGWLRTGDLAYRREGEVFVTGRSKEMITVRGANYYPQDVEQIARTVPGVFRGHCAAVASADGTEQILLIAETALTAAAARELAAALRQRVTAELGLSAVTVRLVKPRAIPRTSSGKIRRIAARDVRGHD
jgi:fatty-acyl-CoA synthase